MTVVGAPASALPRGRGGLFRRISVVILVLLVLTSACSHGAQQPSPKMGNAFRHLLSSRVGLATLGPGYRIGVLALYLENVTSQPLTIQRVEIDGAGAGAVIRVVKTEAVPERGGVHSVPSGGYTTDPPVDQIDGKCHSALLLPLGGYVLDPGGKMRVWVVLEAVSPGSYLITSHRVDYSQGGVRYEQVMPIGYEGEVMTDATGPKTDPSERPCLDMTAQLNS